jgi:threonylcarbamoyladenosine tRNA methylthiotransferase MtaB
MAALSPRVALDFLGCKVNQAENEEFAQQLQSAGYTLVAPEETADVYILNTCTITHVADRKARLLIHQMVRRNPETFIIVTGCYPSVDPEAISVIEGVDLVVPNAEKSRIVDIVKQKVPVDSAPLPDQPTDSARLWGEDAGQHHAPLDRTRAMLKVQDGCENFCTYCIVPLARGCVRSLPIDSVLSAVDWRVALGFQEIVLTGIALGSYGREWPASQRPHALRRLVESILNHTHVPRLRLSSVEPESLDPGLLALWGNRRFCRHLHLPLQSGCDDTLKRMGRRYRIRDFADLVEHARAAAPDAAITTDIITGFPGETEDEFRQSYAFAREMRFARIHVFRFSARRGTPAVRLPGSVPELAKKQRAAQMIALSQESGDDFRHRFLDQSRDVLWEERWPSGGISSTDQESWWTGLTDNYMRVYARSRSDLHNRISNVRLEGEFEDGLKGTIV